MTTPMIVDPADLLTAEIGAREFKFLVFHDRTNKTSATITVTLADGVLPRLAPDDLMTPLFKLVHAAVGAWIDETQDGLRMLAYHREMIEWHLNDCQFYPSFKRYLRRHGILDLIFTQGPANENDVRLPRWVKAASHFRFPDGATVVLVR